MIEHHFRSTADSHWPTLQNTPAAQTGRLKTTVSGSRRRRLWDMPHKLHCPIIGVCFDVDELRRTMARLMDFSRDTSDFTLHTCAVGACEERTPLAESLHKQLEKRFQITIRQHAHLRDTASLRQRWQEALTSGQQLPAMLWTCWSHPACDNTLEQEIYGAIHMLQHQLGSTTRADLCMLKAVQRENTGLRQELAAIQGELASLRQSKARELSARDTACAALQADLASKEAGFANLQAQLGKLRDSLPELGDRQALARRANDAENRALALSAHAAAVDQQNRRLRERLEQLENERIERQRNHPAAAVDRCAPARLAGKAVLCVGGRSGNVEAYRQTIEQRGGRFLHHDGGQEESLHRIDAALAAADLVVCQAGCISHNAYWRVKEACKRTGKPCLYLKKAGTTGLSRLIDEAAH